MDRLITLDQLADRLDRAAVVNRDLTPVMRVAALDLKSDIMSRFQRSRDSDGAPWRPLKYPRPTGAGKPLTDTGRFAGSIEVRHDANSISAGTNAPGARLHNFGGVVTPKRRKYLTIPATREAKRAGSPRRFKGRLRFVTNKGKTGGVAIDPRGVVQYFLTRRVRVPARRWTGWSKPWMDRFMRLLTDHLTKPVKGA